MFQASVPEQAPYGAAEVVEVRIRDARGSNQAPMAVSGDDAVHLAGYFLDGSGDGSYSMLDVQRLQRVNVGLDSGFGAYPGIDPVIVGDLNGNGQLSSLDVNRFYQFALGQPRTEIPAVPEGGRPAVEVSAVRDLRLGTDLAAAPGQLVTVPVTVDSAQGLDGVRVRVVYDPAALQYVQTRPAMTADFQWRLVRDRTVEGGLRTIEIDLARLEPLAGGAGNLLELEFRVQAGAAAGTTHVDLQMVSLDDGRLAQREISAPGNDPTDARITIITGAEPPRLALVGTLTRMSATVTEEGPPPAPPAPVAAQVPMSAPAAAAVPEVPAVVAPVATVTPAPAPAAPSAAMTAAAMQSATPVSRVNWDMPPVPAPVPPAPQPSGPPVADWKAAAWAQDLAQRLADLPVPSAGSDPAAKGNLLRNLSRLLVRTPRP
jgi:hypothetical protein